MAKRYLLFLIVTLPCFLLLIGCESTENITPPQENKASMQSTTELEDTDWLAVSIDAEAFDLDGGFDNPNFEYVLNHTDTVPLDQLIAFNLVADALSEGSSEELRIRFLEAPNKVLAYLVLMGDQQVDYWNGSSAAEVICMSIAAADAAWHDGSEEFAKTMETCRENYPDGPVAQLLDVMEAKHEAIMERDQ